MQHPDPQPVFTRHFDVPVMNGDKPVTLRQERAIMQTRSCANAAYKAAGAGGLACPGGASAQYIRHRSRSEPVGPSHSALIG